MATGFECGTERRPGDVESFSVSTDVPRNALMLSSRFPNSDRAEWVLCFCLNGYKPFLNEYYETEMFGAITFCYLFLVKPLVKSNIFHRIVGT